jgi:hypothetical protein
VYLFNNEQQLLHCLSGQKNRHTPEQFWDRGDIELD